ncbi:hypothetical protein D3C87_10330 [compost metagenome]
MKSFFACILFLQFSLGVSANDGAYFSGGGVIYPIKESNISMEKEILSFQVIDEQCYVTIHFEFLNPGKESKKLLVGFQAPQAAGDVTENDIKYPQIFDFMVSQNQTLLPYQLKTAACEDCELSDKQTIDGHQAGINVFVYLFEIEFKPGITQIDHSYRFKAGSNVMTDQIYNYILKTGAKWAGGKIKDLTVTIDMGENTYFYASDIFGKEAVWNIQGIGRVTNYVYNNFEVNCKMIRILSGSLQIRVQNWNPDQNLEFGIINPNCYDFDGAFHPISRIMRAVNTLRLDIEETPYSKTELKLIRNTFFAQHGYVFSDKDLDAYFRSFEWYIPNPNLKLNIKLTPEIENFIEEIQRQEKI